MPMTREEHEAILNELLNPEIEHSRRTELLQSLRVQHGTDLTDFDTLTTNNKKLTQDNADLVISNSKLFRQIGITESGEETEIKQKEFSETVNLEEIEKEI